MSSNFFNFSKNIFESKYHISISILEYGYNIKTTPTGLTFLTDLGNRTDQKWPPFCKVCHFCQTKAPPFCKVRRFGQTKWP